MKTIWMWVETVALVLSLLALGFGDVERAILFWVIACYSGMHHLTQPKQNP